MIATGPADDAAEVSRLEPAAVTRASPVAQP